jgi:hypothetical protein
VYDYVVTAMFCQSANHASNIRIAGWEGLANVSGQFF